MEPNTKPRTKPYEIFITLFISVYLIGFILNFIYLASGDMFISLVPLTSDETLLSVVNIGKREENVEISITNTVGQFECKDYYDLTYKECEIVHGSMIQYFIKCPELPAKGTIFLSCYHYQKPIEIVFTYDSDLRFTQNNYVCDGTCINELNSTFNIKYGEVIAKSVIPFIPLVK